MSRTVAPAPLDDHRMWRLLMARLHGDAGGSDELFLFGQAVRERLLGGVLARAPETPGCAECRRSERRSEHNTDPDRIPYPPYADFEEVTEAALRRAETGDAYGRLLALLADCRPLPEMREQQQRGATYKMLAAVGHMAGFDGRERSNWYRVCKAVPLSDRHAGHILGRLKRRAA